MLQFTRILTLFVVVLVLTNRVGVAQQFPEQTDHRIGFEPSNEDAFQILRQFYVYDKTYPLNAIVVEEDADSSLAYFKIAITGSNDERIPIEIRIPAGIDSPRVVLLLHGLGSSKERWQEPDRKALTTNLIASGYAVATVDLQYHGERSALNDFQNPVFLTFGDSLLVRSRNMSIQSTIDVLRAIDYLIDRDDIDDNKVGLVGYSMGATIAARAAALDSRIKATVLCAIPTTLQPIPIDPFDFAPRSSASTLILAGATDWLSSPFDLSVLHGLLPGMSNVKLFDAGHLLPPAFTMDAHKWMTDNL